MDGVHALSPAWSMRTYSMRMRSAVVSVICILFGLPVVEAVTVALLALAVCRKPRTALVPRMFYRNQGLHSACRSTGTCCMRVAVA